MIDTAASIPSGSTITTDICIVGSGAAGISMALDLTGKGHRILLLEAGTTFEDPQCQSLYEGEVANERLHSPTDKYRQRCFGGSTRIWGGRCVPFDPIDFERRDYIPYSGWPISHGDLAPYLPAANHYLEAGKFEYDADHAFAPPAAPMFLGFSSRVLRTNGLERFSCPTDAAQRYRARLTVADDVRVLLEANCVGLRLGHDGQRVESADVATLAGSHFKVKARAFVLAAGGLESARLLLASNDVQTQGIGNTYDVVGRYYMCHIAGNIGTLTVHGPTDSVRHGYELSPDGVYCRRRLQLAEEVQRDLRVSNMVARLHFPKIIDPAHRNGVLSGLYLARHFISYEYATRLRDGDNKGLGLELRHVWNVISNPLDAFGFASHWLVKHTFAERKFPSIILRNRTNRFSLEVHSEQIPNPNSRVTLLNQRDALGVPRIKVDWRYVPEDIVMIEKTLDAFAREFKRSGIARFDFNRTTLEQDLLRFGAYGGHHVGTTRMGSDPRSSVVDANCKVHGVGNLFIASSSVFPTSSQANPTLAIVALALRLSEHLHHCLTRERQPDEFLA